MKDVELLSKRSASAMTAISQLSTTSTTDDFINAKIESISADLALNKKLKDYFEGAKTKRKVAATDEEEQKQYDDAIGTLELEVNQKERELVTLKRQKKTIADDMDDLLPQCSTIGAAYSSVLMSKIMSASKQGKKRFDQREFSKAVLSYYGALRTGSGHAEKYCHVTGWQHEKNIKCAHLVPKLLESDELAYLFGVREAILSEARNGMFISP